MASVEGEEKNSTGYEPRLAVTFDGNHNQWKVFKKSALTALIFYDMDTIAKQEDITNPMMIRNNKRWYAWLLQHTQDRAESIVDFFAKDLNGFGAWSKLLETYEPKQNEKDSEVLKKIVDPTTMV